MALTARKIPYYSLLFLLTFGACALLGFLSFGGMYVLVPIIPLAVTAFVLSVVYEYEIYYQNIRGALRKLIKNNYVELEISNKYLLDHFPQNIMTTDCPEFFKDYAFQLKIVHKYAHKRLDKESITRKAAAEKKLRHMEKWFAKQLFNFKAGKEAVTPYEKEMVAWFKTNPNLNTDVDYQLRKFRITAYIAKAFSIIVGLFMALGSTYLLVGAIAVIPFFVGVPYVAIPAIVLPVAIIAGAAYGMLIYNAITDMVANDTVRKWWRKIGDDWRAGHKGHAIFIGVTAVLLGALAITLTVCTAGTWWTIAKTAQPLFSWMAQIPAFVMGVINPIMIGIASIIFNWQNTSETLSMIDKATRADPNANVAANKDNFFVRGWKSLNKAYAKLRTKENLWQVFNPFRILLKAVMLPLRIILFLGHLASMGASDDRMPGIPEFLAFILGTTSEIFEDAHYFFDIAGGHHHVHDETLRGMVQERLDKEHSHSHDVDLPTVVLRYLFKPINLLATVWDYYASRKNPEPLTFACAWERQNNLKPEVCVDTNQAKKPLPTPSPAWRREQALYRIARYREKHFSGKMINHALAHEKDVALQQLHADISALPVEAISKALPDTLNKAQSNTLYAQHRLFGLGKAPSPTATEKFLKQLVMST